MSEQAKKEVQVQDAKLEKLQQEVQELLSNLPNSDRREQDLDDCLDKLTDFEHTLASMNIEVSSLDAENKKTYRKKCQDYERQYKKLHNEMEWQKSLNIKGRLFQEMEPEQDLKTDEGLMKHGQDLLGESKKALTNTQITIASTLETAKGTARQMKEQEDKLASIFNDIGTIGTLMDRANQHVKRIGRKMVTDKLLWVVIFLVIVCIVSILVYKFGFHPNDSSINTPGIHN